jgi:hypothetical protein
MDAVVVFIVNGKATKPVGPGERALDEPADHTKAAAVGRATTAEDRNNAAASEAITMWLRIVATVALQDVRPSARPLAASATRASRWVMSLTFAAVTCASSGTPRAHRSRCGVWTPPCGDRLGSAQFFPPASRGPTAVHHRPALVEPPPSAQLGEEVLMQATPDAGPF